jgi:hypothetical protein
VRRNGRRTANSFVRNSIPRAAGLEAAARALSDIVKRRSIRAQHAAQNRARRAISNQKKEFGNRPSGSF